MCGIAGMAGAADRPILEAMLERTRHRGPDDRGVYLASGESPDARAAIGNNRLAILDLSPNGHQPMSNPAQTIWVAYNGEIYNFRELRAELESEGYKFHSEADTEILPYLYEKYGPSMVRRLNGIFAFAIWDARSRELLIFRDRMGVKPLYYTQLGPRLYFASETKALFECPDVKFEIDASCLPEFLSLLYVPNPGTMLQGIQKLPPGSMLRWKAGEVSVERWWKPEYGDYFTDSEEELARELRRLLLAATERQLISDVPVGFFLSGGLDSSTLVACAAQKHSDLKCFSIQFKDEHGRLEQNDEDARYAAKVARHFGARFKAMEVEPKIVDWLPEVIYHLDDPVADHAAIATYLICKTAKPDVTVLISGQGGDEVFAGYRAHLAPTLANRLKRIPAGLRRFADRSAISFLAKHPGMIPGVKPGLALAFTRHLRRLLHTAELPAREQYAYVRSYNQPDDLHRLIAAPLRDQLHLGSVQQRFNGWFDELPSTDFLNQMLHADCSGFLPDLNLAYSDKLSMACSIEARVPLLDNEIVDFMLRVPPDLKINGTTQKYLMREAVRGLVPDEVIGRRKAGFGLPVRSWLRNELRPMVNDLLSPDRIRRRGLLNEREVASILAANDRGERDCTLQIWAMLTLELWMEAFVDRHRAVPMAGARA